MRYVLHVCRFICRTRLIYKLLILGDISAHMEVRKKSKLPTSVPTFVRSNFLPVVYEGIEGYPLARLV
jgi:hypothetical protein